MEDSFEPSTHLPLDTTLTTNDPQPLTSNPTITYDTWLPTPTYCLPDRTKKSHARRQLANHIPRPRNAFILFRCDFVRQQKASDIKNDNQALSRLAGNVWRRMSPEERYPWVKMAEEEKRGHREKYPHYSYRSKEKAGRYNLLEAPGDEAAGNSKKKTKKHGEVKNNGDSDNLKWPIDDDGLLTTFGTKDQTSLVPMPPLRRPSSCPPGASRFCDPAPDPTLLVNPTAPRTLLVTRDDLARQPSNVVMYTSAPPFLPPASALVNPPDPLWMHLSPTSQVLLELGKKVSDVRTPLNTGAYVVDYSQFGINAQDEYGGDSSAAFNVPEHQDGYAQLAKWEPPHFTDPFWVPREHASNPSTSFDSSFSPAFPISSTSTFFPLPLGTSDLSAFPTLFSSET